MQENKSERGPAARFVPADIGPELREKMPKKTHAKNRTDASEKTKTNSSDGTFRQMRPFHATKARYT